MTISGLSLTGAAAGDYQLLPATTTVDITPASTTTTLLTPLPTTTSAGTTYALTAQVNAAVNGATGAVTFSNNGVAIPGGSHIALATNGQATFVTPVLSGGTNSFTVTFNPSASSSGNFAASTSTLL